MSASRKELWRKNEQAELAEARAASDALTLSERADQAVAWYLVTLVELASRAADADALNSMLSVREEQIPLRRLWDRRARRGQ